MTEIEKLRRLCGYIEDGSSDIVTIYQDDATGTWHLELGHGRKRLSFWSRSFESVISEAYNKYFMEGD